MRTANLLDAPETVREATDAHLLPRLRRSLGDSQSLIFVVLVAVLAFPGVAFLRAYRVNDPDLGWHLRSGEWILQHHAVPHADPFSTYGAAGGFWIAYSWLFSVLIFKLYHWMGLNGVALFEVLMRTALAMALFGLARRLGSSFWQAAALTVVGIYPMFRVIGPRPGMFTILFLILELSILAESRRGRASVLWLLPPMFVLWANLHIQFVYGLFVLGLFAVAPWLGARFRYKPELPAELRGQNTWLVLPACALATLANPYGWRLYETVFQYMGQSKAFGSIVELQAMDFRHAENFAALILGLAAAYCLGWRRDFRPVPILLLLVSSVLAFRAVKDIWFLCVVSLYVLAQRSPAFAEKQGPALRALHHKIAVPLCVLAVLLFAARRYDVSNDTLQMTFDGSFPEGAARYIEHHHLPGPLYNDFSWGGFLIWRLPQYQVSIDGRTNVYGDERVGHFMDVWKGKPGWDSDPELAQARLVIAPKTWPLASLLRQDARFRVAYEDVQAAIFVAR